MTSETGIKAGSADRLVEALDAQIRSGSAPGLVFGLARGSDLDIRAIGPAAPGSDRPMPPDAIFRIASMTKPIAGLVATALALEGVFELDDPIDRHIPELADRRVLVRPDAALDETVPASRPICVEELLTCRMGMGFIMQEGCFPFMEALSELGLTPGAYPPSDPPDVWIKKLASLPLIDQPGTVWRYDTALSVLGVFLERATGRSLDTLFRERVFDPLGMIDTGFHVPTDSLPRLPPECWEDGTVHDPGGAGSRFAAPPAFHSAAAGLVSTARDLLTFATMMLNRGEWRGRRLFPAQVIDAMTQDRIPDDQKRNSPFVPGFWDKNGWGYGVGISYPKDPTDPPGFGWAGGTGTNLYWDPATGLAGVLLTQRLMTSPTAPAHFDTFWRHARAAVA